MNILIISDWGGGLALSQRFLAEGHETKLWIKDSAYSNLGDGMVEKVSDYHEAEDWAEFELCDDIGLWEIAEEMRKKGKVVWGGTEYSDRLELDRGFGQEEMADAGLTILPRQSFSNLDEGIEFIRTNPGRYVFKPDGMAQEDKILTYVGRSETGSDLVTFMEHLQRKSDGKLKSFELQQFRSGVEIGISGFYNGHDFVEPIEVTFEHKKLMTGEIGPATFEMGTTMFWTTRESSLYRKTIATFCEKLKGYTGYFDINFICHDQTMYPLEATCRFGYPTIFLKMETLKGNLGELMYRIASGEDSKIAVTHTIAACVVVATPPWPYSSKEVFEKYGANTMVIIQGATGGKLPPGIYPAEIRYEDGDFYTAGTSGFTVIAAGSGETIEEAKKLAYERVGLVNIPNMMFRTDIGARWDEDMKRLREWGWLE
jgi:phosphoribosylamine--glycine ligase